MQLCNAHGWDEPDGSRACLASYAGQLARILVDVGRVAESHRWHEMAPLHPEAFADHAADFWLAADPLKAFGVAQKNLAVRQTPLDRAVAAVGLRVHVEQVH